MSAPAIKRTLLTTQQNSILVAIEESGLSQEDFRIYPSLSSRAPNRWVTKVERIGAGFEFYYVFDYVDPVSSARMSVFSPAESEVMSWAAPQDWPQQLSHFRRWLIWLKREIDAPDLWKIGYSGSLVDAVSRAGDNSRFTPAEVVEVTKGLREIRSQVGELTSLTKELSTFVDERFAYLEEAAHRSPRIDWMNIFISQMLSLAQVLALEPDSVARLVSVSNHVFQWLAGQPLLPGN